MYLTRWWLHFWFPPCPWQVYSFTLLPGLLSMRSKQSSSCQNSSFFVYMKNWEEKAHTEKIRIHDSYILKVAISRSKEKMRAISIIMLNLTFKRQTVFRFLSIKHPKDPNPKDPNIRISEQCRVPSRKLSWNITQAFGLSFRWRIVFFWKHLNVFYYNITYRLTDTRISHKRNRMRATMASNVWRFHWGKRKRCLADGEIP